MSNKVFLSSKLKKKTDH